MALFFLLARLRIAWRFRVWPWQVPWQAVRYLSFTPITPHDIERTKQLAERYGWK